MSISKLATVIKKPTLFIEALNARGLLKWIPDQIYIQWLFKVKVGRKLNIEYPITYNEKLQWLKINNRNHQYTKMVDKLAVREYISQKIGKQYLIPLLGYWDCFDEIDFEHLPEKFVMKTTHDSGGIIICKNKDNMNKEEARFKINKSLKRNYYYVGREWPYKNVEPRIICEELLETLNGKLPYDYKFYCFNGNVDSVMICTERETGKPKFYFFDKDWQLLPYNKLGKLVPKDFTLEKPDKMEEMFEIAGILSEGIPFVRIDLYCENNKIYFGEMTFFPDSGYDSNLLDETDLLFGSKITLT